MGLRDRSMVARRHGLWTAPISTRSAERATQSVPEVKIMVQSYEGAPVIELYQKVRVAEVWIEVRPPRRRAEHPNKEMFSTLKEARALIESWRRYYNVVRPHNSLGYRPSVPETIMSDWPTPPASLTEKPPMHQHSHWTSRWGLAKPIQRQTVFSAEAPPPAPPLPPRRPSWFRCEVPVSPVVRMASRCL